MLLRIPLENGGNAVLLTLPYQIISLTLYFSGFFYLQLLLLLFSVLQVAGA